MIGTSAVAGSARSSLQTSMPDMPGIVMSSNARSGISSRAEARADRPSSNARTS